MTIHSEVISPTQGEEQFIRMIRAFDFLRQMGYVGREFNITGAYGPAITLVKRQIVRAVIVYIEDGLHVIVSRSPHVYTELRSAQFTLRELAYQFDVDLSPGTSDIERHAEFLRLRFMPILEGKVWIDQLYRHISGPLSDM